MADELLPHTLGIVHGAATIGFAIAFCCRPGSLHLSLDPVPCILYWKRTRSLPTIVYPTIFSSASTNAFYYSPPMPMHVQEMDDKKDSIDLIMLPPHHNGQAGEEENDPLLFEPRFLHWETVGQAEQHPSHP